MIQMDMLHTRTHTLQMVSINQSIMDF